MSAIPPTTRRRRPMSLGEFALLASLIVLVASVALIRNGYASSATHGGQAGLTLMNVQSPDPGKVDRAAKPAVNETVTAEEAVVVEEAVVGDGPTVMFNGRPLRLVKQITMLTTAYSPDEKSCGKWADGFTASGYSVWTNGMKLVAADTSILPFGSIVSVPGYNGGKPVPVLDRGGKIKGNRLDLLYPTHDIALKWGAQRLVVDVWEYAD